MAGSGVIRSSVSSPAIFGDILLYLSPHVQVNFIISQGILNLGNL
jgi:hypothetical protein